MRTIELLCRLLGHDWARLREGEMVLAKCKRCGKVTDADSARHYGDSFGMGAGG